MSRLPVLTVCAALWFPFAAIATENEDLELIRQQIDMLRNDYEHRIQALEERLQKAEAAMAQQQAADAEAVANEAVVSQTAAIPSFEQEKANTFNPAISAVLQGSINSYSRDPDDYALSGFQLGDEAGLSAEGLTLDETELTLSANVDHLFYGETTLSFSDDASGSEVEIEEAFFDALAMPGGTSLRVGRFFSNIGYLNSFHSHAWDFHDAPLAYRAFLGKQYSDTGVRLAWIAPTDLYLQFGGETLRGDRFPGGEATDTLGNSQSLFTKLGGDVGASHSWQLGLSQLWVDAVDRETSGSAHGANDNDTESFSGDSNLTILDFVWKWAPNGNPVNRNFKFQTELFYRSEDGTDDFTQAGDTAVLDYEGTQKGMYAQILYQFMSQWRIGARYDRLLADNDLTVIDAGGLNPDAVLQDTALNNHNHDPWRWSLMADWSPSEFSRLRLQYNRDSSRPVIDNQWTLQYIMSLGAHGAHQF